MISQFKKKGVGRIHYKNISRGLLLFALGLGKKVLIADTFAVWANAGFDVTTRLNFIEAWMTSLSYSLQLFYDFSGYTDMAIGLALFFNIRFPQNFDKPYRSLNIREFWRRWHITLSNFLRDYVYIPLGGNRQGEIRTYTNLLITFVIGGIWHGAGWLFLIWGLMHGIALVLHRIWTNARMRLQPVLAWFLTFNFVNVAWVFFRALSVDDALKVLRGMAGKNGIVGPFPRLSEIAFFKEIGFRNGTLATGFEDVTSFIYLFIIFFALSILGKSSYEFAISFKPRWYVFVSLVIVLIISILGINRVSEFIYFQF